MSDVRVRLAKEIEDLASDRAKHASLATEINEESAKLTAELKAVDAIRLAQRQFMGVGADAIVNTMLWNPNADEIWDKTYKDKYVRWQGKFLEKNILTVFSANVGNSAIVQCSLLDDTESRDVVDKYEKWQAITIEGSLSSVSKESGEMRATIKLDDCIVK